MAYEGWIDYDGVEIVNAARTLALSRALGINTVKVTSAKTDWLKTTLVGDGTQPFNQGPFGQGPFGGGENYADIVNAPWYDANHQASKEFAGLLSLRWGGLGDSTLTSTPTEYINDGGNAGRARNATLPIVVSLAIIASTERGAEFGKRWMDRMLRKGGSIAGPGAKLTYFRYTGSDSPKVHLRKVKVTRGSTVTARRTRSCASTWLVSVTLTAGDPYEYGEAVPRIDNFGRTGVVPTGNVLSQANISGLTQTSCPQFDYSPIYDPIYPALISAPPVPDFFPDGWGIEDGKLFRRFWARTPALEPSEMLCVPIITLSTQVDARMVRVSIWPSDSLPDDQCDPLFSVVISYLPASIDPANPLQFVIDGEQKACYVFDGLGTSVRRSDSLVFSPDANPVQWTAFTDDTSFLFTIDLFARTIANGGGYESGDTLKASLALVPKSD